MITLQTIGVMIICSGLGIVLTRKFRLPHIVLYILTGLALGQLELAFLEKDVLKESQGAVRVISESGIALLLFLVGMELSLAKIKDVGKDSLVGGLWQVSLTTALAAGLALVMGFSLQDSILLGVAMAFSSTVIVVKLLGEKRDLEALYGRVSIGILLVQDLVVILVLTVLVAMKDADKNILSTGMELGKAFLGVALLLAVTLLVSKKLVGKIMNWASSSTETLLVWSLTWCFLIVSLAHLFKLSHEVGAFLAGISLAQLPLSNSLKQRVHPLMNFFIGIFFISLGMEIDLATALDNWRPSAAFVIFVLLVKTMLFVFIFLKRGFSKKVSFMSAITLAQISEFSFLFIALCKSAGLVGDISVAIVALTGLATFIISSFLIIYNKRTFELFERRGWLRRLKTSGKNDSKEILREKMEKHVIVVGMNSLGREISRCLHTHGHLVLAIDNDPKKLSGLPCKTLVGNADYGAILDEASFADSKLVVTTLRIEDVNNSLVYKCKRMGVPVAAHGFDSTVIPDLKRLGADYIIDSKSAWLRKLLEELKERGVSLS